MELRLLDNGSDILKAGILYYKRFLSFNNSDELDLQEYLKLGIICIHHAVEMFCKKILSDINDLLIYQDLSRPILEQIKIYVDKGQNSVPLHYHLILGEKCVKTIDYLECINRIKTVFDIDANSLRDLEQLEKAQNRIIYFGLKQVVDFHDIIGILNRVLSFINRFFYPKLSSNKNDGLVLLFEQVNDIIKYGNTVEKEIWEAFISKKMKQLKKLLTQICRELNVEIKDKNIRAEIESTDQYDIAINFLDNNTDRVVNRIRTKQLSRFNTVAFSGDDVTGPIHFMIDYSRGDEALYMFHPPCVLPELVSLQQKFWDQEEGSVEINFSFENLKKVLFHVAVISYDTLQ